ncbi:MAG: hypothetical protein Kow00124_02920 [Anaerolineae bacterium]
MSDGDTTPQSLDELEPKMKLRGTVKTVDLAGAVLDVGMEYDAVLNNTQIKKRGVVNARTVLQEGQSVTVWVRSVDHERRCIMVTMIRPPELDWDSIEVGQVYQGKVIRIKKFGVFVDIGAERPGLVHISELAHEFVATPQDKVQKGQDVTVKVINVDREKKQIDLSIKALEELPVPERAQRTEMDEPEESLPTAMQLAFQRAMARSEAAESKEEKAETKRGARRKEAEKREDLLDRTLKEHRPAD